MHNYIKDEIIIEKIKQNKVTNEEMKDPLYQKYFFLETFLNYPHLTYNQIALNIIEKYNLKKLSFTNNSFNVMKSNYNKKKYFNKNIEDKLNEIKIQGKSLMKCKLEYVDRNKPDVEKKFRIYGTVKSMKKLYSKEIEQYFTDCTYRCIPN